jgi:dienelactone hydrolase
MKQHPDGFIDWRIFVIFFVVALTCLGTPMEGSSQRAVYDPPSERGPIVILLSGASGLNRFHRTYAAEIAQLGYYAVLLDGNNFDASKVAIDGEGNLRRAIEEAQRSPKALPGKSAVIGVSRGGGGALTYATGMPDLVSVVVVYYPATKSITDMRSFVVRFKVPILVLAGERDRYIPIKTIRALEAAAKKGGATFELVVYPNADHDFTWVNTPTYRPDDSADAWQHTKKMLSQHQPIP